MIQCLYNRLVRDAVEKIWYILINEQKEGPYSLLDLRRDERITPDTLVWKEGFKNWVPIRTVPELKVIFEDQTEEEEEKDEENEKKAIKKKVEETDVIAIRSVPPYHYIWLIIAFLMIFYAFYQFYRLIH